MRSRAWSKVRQSYLESRSLLWRDFLFYLYPMEILIQNLIEQKQHFVCKRTNEELLLIPLKDNVADFNQYLVLNEVGAFIWEQLHPESTAEELKTAISAAFDAPDSQIDSDLAQFINELDRYTSIQWQVLEAYLAAWLRRFWKMFKFG